MTTPSWTLDISPNDWLSAIRNKIPFNVKNICVEICDKECIEKHQKIQIVVLTEHCNQRSLNDLKILCEYAFLLPRKKLECHLKKFHGNKKTQKIKLMDCIITNLKIENEDGKVKEFLFEIEFKKHVIRNIKIKGGPKSAIGFDDHLDLPLTSGLLV